MKYVCVAISPLICSPLSHLVLLSLSSFIAKLNFSRLSLRLASPSSNDIWAGQAHSHNHSHNTVTTTLSGDGKEGPETTSMSMAIEHNNNTNTYAHTRATSAVRSLAGNSDASSFSCWLRRLVSILPIPIPIPTPYSRLLTPGLPVSPSTSYQRASTVCRLPSAAIPARPTVGQWAGVQRLEVKL